MSLKALLGAAAGFFIGGPAGAALGATLGGGFDQSNAATEAANTSAAANDKALALQQQMYEKNIALQKEMFDLQRAGQEPYRQAGLTGQNRLMELLGLGGKAGAAGYGKYAKDFSMADYQADPGYAFRLSEGQKALERSAAARGGLISGGALKAATRYGQDMGSQEYQNAYNRYQQNRTNQLQPLGNLMASGQSAASNQGVAAGNYGTNVGAAGQAYGTSAGNLYSATGENQGNALMAGANARSSAYGAAARLLPQVKFTNPFASDVSGSWNSATGTFQ